jgi:hypothetical protein
MEEEAQLVEEVEEMEQESTPCQICQIEIPSEEPRIECDWCGLEFHERCEFKTQTCPNCGRHLPTAKMKALSADRKYSSVLLVVPFVVIEVLIAVVSWLTHPSGLSVPDLDNWISMGLIVNIILLVVALISMGAAGTRGEGVEKPEEEEGETSEEPVETG